MEIILTACLFAFVSAVLFSLLGVIPGTDETATLAPLTLVIVLWGAHPTAILAWFLAGAVAMQITHTIPTAIAAIPGSTMAAPFIENCAVLKRLGLPHIAIKKMAAASILGSLVALPIALMVARLLSPIGDLVKGHAPLIFTVGALLIAFFSKTRWLSVFAILPFAFFIHGLQGIATSALGHKVFISIFLGIAVGPMVADLVCLLSRETAKPLIRKSQEILTLAPDTRVQKRFFPNPLRFLTRKQRNLIFGSSTLAAFTFTFSPIGMTILLGEFLTARIREVYQKTTTAVSIMDGLTNSTYVAETLIPLIAFGIPLSPTTLGPAFPLFHAPPRFTGIEGSVHNLHNLLGFQDFAVFSLLGLVVGILVAYPLTMHYAWKLCGWVLRRVSHEALVGTFTGLIVLLAYYEAGVTGIFLSLSIAVFGGLLKKYLGVHIGVQYMAFYASPWIVGKIVG